MDIDWNFLFLYSCSEWRIWAQCCSSSTSTIRYQVTSKDSLFWTGPRSSLPFPYGTYDRCFTFLLWPIWSHFLPIYICFKISVLRPPWIHLDTWYQLFTQNWMNFVKKHDFFHFRPKKGFNEGINRFNPQYFWPIILPNFLRGAIYWPLGT